MDAKITNSNENKANPGNYSTQGFTGDPLILFLYLKTTSMRINWKRVALYVLRVIELVITGAAGGAMTQL